MQRNKVLIIGGGLAGLSAGCYARSSGFDVTIVEHNLALGGVCTAWHRGPYLIDGCIHWLTGGPFLRLYEELGIVPAVSLRTLDQFATCRDARTGAEVTLRRDLDRTAAELRALAPEDADELARLLEGAKHVAELDPHVDRPPELGSMRDRLLDIWGLRHEVDTLLRFRKPFGRWVNENLKNAALRSLFSRLMPPESPTLFLQFVLGYLARGWLSRPVGGTARFRDALIERYRTLGGTVVLNNTVEEVLVTQHRATGVRLTDGTMLDADVVISTASAPETVFRLLAGRYGAPDWRTRTEQWPMFQPIVLASFGISRSLDSQPSTLILDGIEPLTIGGHANEHLYLRIYNEDPAFAPPGHTVVQTMLATDYDWWATRGARYQQEKDRAADCVLTCLDQHLPGIKGATRMVDIATPLTFWRSARSWRGAFEGWIPTSNMFKHVPKELPGLERFYMAGQWVEPGGGVPTAVMSGRHVVEIICAALERDFLVPSPPERVVA